MYSLFLTEYFLNHIPWKEENLVILRVYGEIVELLDFPIPLQPISPRLKNSSTTPRTNPKLEKITLHHLIRADPANEDIIAYDELFKRERARVTIRQIKEYKSLLIQAYKSEIRKADIIFCTCTNAAAMKFKNTNCWKQVGKKL